MKVRESWIEKWDESLGENWDQSSVETAASLSICSRSSCRFPEPGDEDCRASRQPMPSIVLVWSFDDVRSAIWSAMFNQSVKSCRQSGEDDGKTVCAWRRERELGSS